MSVRKKGTFRKFASKLKRGGKRSVIKIAGVSLIPIRLIGGTVKIVGESVHGRGERAVNVGRPLGKHRLIWRGRAYKLVGNGISFMGNTISYPVLIFDDHTNNVKARMDLEARMDGFGWQTATVVRGDEFMPQGATGRALSFIPKNDHAISETKAIRMLQQDDSETQ